jgi:glycosyltransferase involved in cell wall biosynthesis
MSKGKVSVILPVYNEGKVLKRNVRDIEQELKGSIGDFEIIIAEDGSTDGTAAIARSMSSERIRVLDSRKRLGKGAAIRRAANYADGDILVFMDADLASHPKQAGELVRLIRGGAAIVIGSRYLAGSRADRTPIRYFASKSFNMLVKGILGSKLSDHQCGFKAFRKDLILPVINKVEDKGWFWDTELLVRAQRDGLKVAEIPIEWKESGDSRFRLINDTCRMGMSLLRFRFR